MRKRLVGTLILVLAGGLTLSLLRGQERPTTTPKEAPLPEPLIRVVNDNIDITVPDTAATVPDTAAPKAAPLPPAASPAKPRDFSHLSPLQADMLGAARRGADWLFRMNGVKGRFLYGYLPALQTPMEGDSYLRQIGAAFALARAARFTGEERYAVRATQAVLALLDETVSDPKDAQVRHTAMPALVVNRLGAAGLLVLAVHELPAPQADLLDRAEQLCNYVRAQARPDGSLRCDDAAEAAAADAAEAVSTYPGLALHGLAHSQRLRPAPWKLDLLRKAVAYYRPWWQKNKNMTFIPSQTAAYAEAYLLTKEAAFADCVTEMNDWLCGLQYDQIDPRHVLWYGGFAGWADGRKVEAVPDVGCAPCAASLADAVRVARAAADVARHQTYAEALERGLQFLVTLQYTDANAQHFADWYRPRVAGAFHASHQDGNVRIDYAQHALSALVQYLDQAR
jgi:hypothetical protein